MTNHRKKVLFLITKSNWGGAQRYVYDLAVGLPKDKFEVVVALGVDENGDVGPLGAKLQAAGVRVFPLRSLTRDISLAKEIDAIKEIWWLIRKERPDVLHINSSKAGALGALIGRLLFVPKVIFTAHGWAFNENRPGWQKFILKSIHWFTVLVAHKTIAVSHELKRQLDWPLAHRKMTVIHNGRDIKDLKGRDESRNLLIQHEPKLAPYKDDFWSITVAELHPIKRHDAVIESMKKVVDRFPYTRHIIIGSGQEERYLRDLIEVLRLGDHIFLLGPIDEAANYLKAADLFILASRSEALAYVAIEACLAGLPIVATRVGGLPEIIEHERSGLLSRPLDNEQLTDFILELRSNEVKRQFLAQGALVQAQHFNFNNSLLKTTALYLT